MTTFYALKFAFLLDCTYYYKVVIMHIENKPMMICPAGYNRLFINQNYPLTIDMQPITEMMNITACIVFQYNSKESIVLVLVKCSKICNTNTGHRDPTRNGNP